jgi:6-phospho-beta-glucosidase
MERSNVVATIASETAVKPERANEVTIAIIGGAGIRTPLLVRGLARSRMPIREIRVFDTDRDRLRLIAPLTERVASVNVRVTESAEACVKGAHFVIASIRPGGIDRRAEYERIALDHGVVGQETVGVGGWAMALATIPAMVDYAKVVASHAPDAWMLSFTNPVGMVTEGVLKATSVPVIGICDTPIELFQEIAHAIGESAADCHFDYVGLNHLGWVREVWVRGEPHMKGILADDTTLAKIYRRPLFENSRLRELGALPTEYVYFYESPERAVANSRRGGTSRGAAIANMNDALFETLRAGREDSVKVYETYLAERSGTYLALEGEGDASRVNAPSEAALLSGYDKIAVSVIDAIHRNTGDLVPLSVANKGNIHGLRDDDVVEVPCLVNANGPRALHVGAPPDRVRSLLERVKAYERATVAAALDGSRDAAIEALALNPLVPSRDLAATLARHLLP